MGGDKSRIDSPFLLSFECCVDLSSFNVSSNTNVLFLQLCNRSTTVLVLFQVYSPFTVS